MKVSFICVYNRSNILNKNLVKSLENQNEDYELILIDNRNFKFKNAADALNYGVKKATGDYLFFAQQDVNFNDPNWVKEILKEIETLNNPGIIGIDTKNNEKINRDIKEIDDSLFIIPKKAFNVLQFDEETCFDWYLYATDYLLSIKKLDFETYSISAKFNNCPKEHQHSENYLKTIENLQKKYLKEKIIFINGTEWYTYIPLSSQIKIKESERKNNIKLNIFEKYLKNKEISKKYGKINPNTYNLIKNSGFFDEDYYKKEYKISADMDPLTHYATIGYRKNYNPSLKFDTKFYLEKYPDVKSHDLNPLYHYLVYGKKEGRIISPVKKSLDLGGIKHKTLNKTTNPKEYLLLKSKFNVSKFNEFYNDYKIIKNSEMFDSEFYLKNYPDAKDFNNDLILHYMFIGSKFDYEPNNYFNSSYYKRKYGLNKNPLLMYLKNEPEEPMKFKNINYQNKKIIEESGLFNKQFYLENYPETKKYKDDLITHYLNIGFKKGFNPSPFFNTEWYLDTYEDVKKSNMNPLIHYINYGQYEKRIAKPLTQEEAQIIMDKLNYNAKNEPLEKFDEDSPLVSIIILTRDGIDYLKTLFKNFKETVAYPNYEIIVVDNDSSDETVEYLKELSETLPITIIENKVNETFSDANNKAVERSNGEYILLLNNDMEPIYGWLNHMMHSYLKSDDIGIVGAKLIYPFRENNPTSLTTQNEGIKYTELDGFLNNNDGFIVPFNIKENDVFFKDDKDEEIASILGASLLIKKDLYLEVGGLDDCYFYNYEDIDLCFKIMEKGYKVIYAPKAKLYHYYQATRKDTFDLSPNDMKNRTNLYHKWNKWLSEKLFIDRIENKQIFSETPLNIFYLSKTHNLIKTDELINAEEAENYKYTETFTKKHKGITINKLHWNLIPLKSRKNIELRKNADILLSDDPIFNPDEVVKHNKHQIKIALVNENFEEWMKNNNLNKYDIIFSKETIFSKIKENENAYILNNQSIFKQIKNVIVNLHKNDINEFNRIIKNFDFEDVYPNAKEYLSIYNSEYFDEEWYETNYDISDNHLDPINHYIKIGFKKGYNPSENFNNEDYFICNPDVKKAGINPLVHYELYGKDEKRQIKCSKEEYESYKEFLSLTNPKNYSNTKKQFKTKNNQIFFFSPWSDEKKGELNENSKMIFDSLNDKYEKKVYTYKKRPHIGDYLEILHNLLESKVIILDQGWGILSELKLKEEQKVINIWHACGAFKKIGYDAPVYSDLQLDKFGKQFAQYTNFIVSSPKIENIYANAHGMDEKDVLGLGVPRTDMFFDEEDKQKQLTEFFEDYPELKNKEIILFAPTFRDTYTLDTKIDWDKLSQNLKPDEVFIIKRHIMTTEDILNGKEYKNIFYLEDVSLFTLMYASKLMITDYSSVIFEYSLLNKPVIHYCPDYEEYISMRDFYLDFDTELYGKIIKEPDELLKILTDESYKLDYDKLNLFKDKYMSACDGNATERVVKLIEGYMEE